MRRAYIVTYDIANPKRLRLVYRLMLGWGDHLQLSVFQCDLSPRELVQLKSDLSDIVNHNEDQVLFCCLGLVEGRGSEAIESVGKPYIDPQRSAVIV